MAITFKTGKCPICHKSMLVGPLARHIESHARDSRCLFCNEPVRCGRKYCDSSCFASHNNTKRAKPKKPCLYCGDPVKRKASKFCRGDCHKKHTRDEYIRKWLAGEVDGTSCDGAQVSEYVRAWLLSRQGHRCALCGRKRWMGKPIPLVLDHADGNADNCRESNLRYVCGNCNMQLPTFSGRNRGKGRAWRRERRRKGLNA